MGHRFDHGDSSFAGELQWQANPNMALSVIFSSSKADLKLTWQDIVAMRPGPDRYDYFNVGRFIDLVGEMAAELGTRFLVITHHAVTMAKMDRLYGVTMGEPGVSNAYSVDLRRAELALAS